MTDFTSNDFTSRPCPDCQYTDGVLVRQCDGCRQAMAEIDHPPNDDTDAALARARERLHELQKQRHPSRRFTWVEEGRLHIPTLQAAARAVCYWCRIGAPKREHGAMHWTGTGLAHCASRAIHELIAKEQEAANDPR